MDCLTYIQYILIYKILKLRLFSKVISKYVPMEMLETIHTSQQGEIKYILLARK